MLIKKGGATQRSMKGKRHVLQGHRVYALLLIKNLPRLTAHTVAPMSLSVIRIATLKTATT